MEPDPAKELEAEIELLKRVAAGDRRAFEELYDRFSGVLFAAAYRTLNDQQAAEDVVQDAFLQIWDKAPLYDPTRGKPKTWALTLTRNKAIDRLRSVRRRHRVQDEFQVEAQTFVQFDERTSFESIVSGETRELVRKAMESLSTDQRAAIELAFFHSLTQAEIAERLAEPLGTVKARIRRGMLRLKELISAGG